MYHKRQIEWNLFTFEIIQLRKYFIIKNKMVNSESNYYIIHFYNPNHKLLLQNIYFISSFKFLRNN